MLRFGEFCLDLGSAELRTAAGPVRLQQQPQRVLRVLLERHGELVTRAELKRLVWGAVEKGDLDQRLNFCIKHVRAALGDRADTPRFLETLPRRGYRFIARLEPAAAAAPPRPAGRGRATWRRLGAVAAALLSLSLPLAAPPSNESRTRLAVLPFQGLLGTARDELSDGLTEETINGLGRLSPERLGVIARTSAMAYKGAAKPLRQVGRELGVSHVLEGSVCRARGRIHVEAKLSRVNDQSQLWAERYFVDGDDLLQLQSQVAERIASSLRERLLPTAAATATPPARAPASVDTVGA